MGYKNSKNIFPTFKFSKHFAPRCTVYNRLERKSKLDVYFPQEVISIKCAKIDNCRETKLIRRSNDKNPCLVNYESMESRESSKFSKFLEISVKIELEKGAKVTRPYDRMQ